MMMALRSERSMRISVIMAGMDLSSTEWVDDQRMKSAPFVALVSSCSLRSEDGEEGQRRKRTVVLKESFFS